MKNLETGRQPQNGQQEGSRISVIGMVSDGNIRRDYNPYGIYPFSRIYYDRTYQGNDPAYPGYYRVPAAGTKERRGAGIFIRAHQLYQ